MSQRYLSPTEPDNKEIDADSCVKEAEQIVHETTNKVTPIRLSHIIILGGLGAFGPLAIDMYLPALPDVSRDLGTSMSLTQLTLSACILGLSLGQVIAGPISDALG